MTPTNWKNDKLQEKRIQWKMINGHTMSDNHLIDELNKFVNII